MSVREVLFRSGRRPMTSARVTDPPADIRPSAGRDGGIIEATPAQRWPKGQAGRGSVSRTTARPPAVVRMAASSLHDRRPGGPDDRSVRDADVSHSRLTSPMEYLFPSTIGVSAGSSHCDGKAQPVRRVGHVTEPSVARPGSVPRSTDYAARPRRLTGPGGPWMEQWCAQAGAGFDGGIGNHRRRRRPRFKAGPAPPAGERRHTHRA